MVRERHGRKRYLFGSTIVNRFVKAVRSADEKHQVAGIGQLFFFEEIGKSGRRKRFSRFIKQHEVIGRVKIFKDQFRFCGLLPLFAPAFGVFQLREFHQFKRHIVLQSR